MSYRARLRELLEKATDTRILRDLPRGLDPLEDIRKYLPACRTTTVFDVGANVGQSADEMLGAFPDARLFCFEPVQQTFSTLRERLSQHKNVSCFHCALGATAGTATIAVSGSSDRSGLVDSVKDQAGSVETVPVLTLDSFCNEQGITHIDFLKIDTEGADLKVLQGGEGLIARQEIDVIQVEAGMNSGNLLHVPFEEFRVYLEARNYFLFGVYEQMHEWPTKQPHLRRTNPVFISRRVIDANTPAS